MYASWLITATRNPLVRRQLIDTKAIHTIIQWQQDRLDDNIEHTDGPLFQLYRKAKIQACQASRHCIHHNMTHKAAFVKDGGLRAIHSSVRRVLEGVGIQKQLQKPCGLAHAPLSDLCGAKASLACISDRFRCCGKDCQRKDF